MTEQNTNTVEKLSDSSPETPPVLAGAVIDLTHLAEENTDGVVIFDHAGIYLFVNREAERILNVPRRELLGKSVWDRFPPVRNGYSASTFYGQ